MAKNPTKAQQSVLATALRYGSVKPRSFGTANLWTGMVVPQGIAQRCAEAGWLRPVDDRMILTKEGHALIARPERSE